MGIIVGEICMLYSVLFKALLLTLISFNVFNGKIKDDIKYRKITYFKL